MLKADVECMHYKAQLFTSTTYTVMILIPVFFLMYLKLCALHVWYERQVNGWKLVNQLVLIKCLDYRHCFILFHCVANEYFYQSPGRAFPAQNTTSIPVTISRYIRRICDYNKILKSQQNWTYIWQWQVSCRLITLVYIIPTISRLL